MSNDLNPTTDIHAMINPNVHPDEAIHDSMLTSKTSLEQRHDLLSKHKDSVIIAINNVEKAIDAVEAALASLRKGQAVDPIPEPEPDEKQSIDELIRATGDNEIKTTAQKEIEAFHKLKG